MSETALSRVDVPICWYNALHSLCNQALEVKPTSTCIDDWMHCFISTTHIFLIFFRRTLCRGARIHSDSWGTGSSAYDALAYDVDLFAYVYQDFLPVFAAGNLGYEEVDSTVSSPSVSKNCLSVGELLAASCCLLIWHCSGPFCLPLQFTVIASCHPITSRHALRTGLMQTLYAKAEADTFTHSTSVQMLTNPHVVHYCRLCHVYLPCTGASLTASYSGTIEQEVVTTDSLTYQMTVAGSLTATSTADLTHTVMLAYFGGTLASAVSAATVYSLVAGVPADGCSALSYPHALAGKVVLLARGNCTFEHKVSTLTSLCVGHHV